jgi:hypothetical protein
MALKNHGKDCPDGKLSSNGATAVTRLANVDHGPAAINLTPTSADPGRSVGVPAYKWTQTSASGTL